MVRMYAKLFMLNGVYKMKLVPGDFIASLCRFSFLCHLLSFWYPRNDKYQYITRQCKGILDKLRLIVENHYGHELHNTPQDYHRDLYAKSWTTFFDQNLHIDCSDPRLTALEMVQKS